MIRWVVFSGSQAGAYHQGESHKSQAVSCHACFLVCVCVGQG